MNFSPSVPTLSLSKVDAQLQVVRKLEEKEHLLQSSIGTGEKELGLRTQALEMNKRKVSGYLISSCVVRWSCLLSCGKPRRLWTLVGIIELGILWFWTSIPEGWGVLKRVLMKVLWTDVLCDKEVQVMGVSMKVWLGSWCKLPLKGDLLWKKRQQTDEVNWGQVFYKKGGVSKWKIWLENVKTFNRCLRSIK